MGIRPNGQALPTVAYDTPQQQFGDTLSALDSAGTVAGDALADIASTADSANSAVKVLADGQLALQNQTELLNGVRGYCCAYQSLNITTGKTENLGSLGIFKTWSAEERLLPYNAPVGPSKGAHVSETGIVFDEPGLWTVYVMCRRKKPSSNPASYVTAHVFNELGEPFVNRQFAVGKFDADYRLNSGDQRLSGGVYQAFDTSVTMVFPVVIPAAGYSVAVGVLDTQRDAWWVGGTEYSTLSVLKHDSRTENPGESTVPDEAV